MAIVQSGTPATPAKTTAGSVTGAWGTGQNRAAGNLLAALVTASGSTSAAATAGTAGWTKIFESTNTLCRAAIWTKPAAGADAVPTFTSTISGTAQMSCTLIELTDNVNAGRLPVLDTGQQSTGTSGTLTTTTAAAVAAAGEYAVAVDCALGTTSATNTWGTSGSWTNSFNDGLTAVSHWVAAVQAGPASGSTLAYAPTHTSTSTQQGGASAVFATGPTPGAAAVDAVGPAGGLGNYDTTGTAGSYAHVNNGNAILVGLTNSSGVVNTISSVTYGGVALSFLGYIVSQGGSNGGLSVYGLISGSLPTGSNNVVWASTSAVVCAGSVSFTGAGSFGTLFTSGTTNGGSVTVNVTGTTAGGLIGGFACYGGASGGGTFSATTGTLRINCIGDFTTAADNLAGSTVPSPGGTQAVGFSTSAPSDDWGLIAVEVKPAGGAAGPPARLLTNRGPVRAALTPGPPRATFT